MAPKFKTGKSKVQVRPTEIRLHTYDKEQIKYRLNHYTSFIVTRDPLSRLVSNFKDKFSDPTLNSWRRRLCKQILNQMTAMGQKHNTAPTNISIGEFADYVINLLSRRVHIKLNHHWRPMTVLCRPCHIFYDYYSWTETIGEDAEYLLRKFKAPPGLHFIRENQSPTAVTRPPGTNDRQYYLSKLSDHQLNQLISVYKRDYEIFGYDLPR
jgi:uncharacterized protein YejL (UPF0352 family)